MISPRQSKKCSKCGSLKESDFCNTCNCETQNDLHIQVSDIIKIRETLVLRNMFGTAKAFISELVSGWFPSTHSKLSEGIKKSRIIDRGQDQYHEIIKKADSDEIIREIHEPLSRHQTNPNTPNFVIGKANLAQDTNTKIVRAVIGDEFGGGKNLWDLQCVEYVHYKIKDAVGINIQWPHDRPRHGRLWAGIFLKNNLYKVLDEPLANCAMSFTNPSFNSPYGHVAFVESVLPDGSVKISEINWPKSGIYNERVVAMEDWQNKYKAKFIDFT